MKTRITTNAVAILLATFAAIAMCKPAQAVVVADIAGDWVNAATLPAGWSYLQSNAATGGTETALTANVGIGLEGSIGFGGGGAHNMAAILGDNANGGDYEMFGDGQPNHGGIVGTDLLMHPNNNNAVGQFVIARYTMSTAGNATISGGYHGNLGGRIGSVYHNGVALYTSLDGTPDRATSGAFNVGTTVAIGDTISFVLDSGGNFGGDETAIRATIDVEALPAAPAPEPSTLVLAAFGLIGLTCGRRRRNRS